MSTQKEQKQFVDFSGISEYHKFLQDYIFEKLEQLRNEFSNNKIVQTPDGPGLILGNFSGDEIVETCDGPALILGNFPYSS